MKFLAELLSKDYRVPWWVWLTVGALTACLDMAVGAGSYSKVGALHVYSGDEDWSSKGAISIWLYGQGTGYTRNVGLWAPDSSNKKEYTFTDSWTGWSQLLIPFENMVDAGSPDLSMVRRVYVTIIPGGNYDWYIDRTMLTTVP